MSTRKNTDDLFDEAESIIKNTDLLDLIDDELDEINHCTPEELEKARKKYMKEQYIHKLELTDIELLRFNHKDYKLEETKHERELKEFFSTFGKDIYHIMEPETYDNGTRLIRDERLIRQIKDRKFQKYVTIRKGLYALKKKIEKSNVPSKAYLNTEIMAITKRLDDYIASYLVMLLVLSNTDQLIEYVDCKLKQKRRTNKNIIDK